MTEIAKKTQTSPFIAPLDPTLHVVHCVQLKECVLNATFHIFKSFCTSEYNLTLYWYFLIISHPHCFYDLPFEGEEIMSNNIIYATSFT